MSKISRIKNQRNFVIKIVRSIGKKKIFRCLVCQKILSIAFLLLPKSIKKFHLMLHDKTWKSFSWFVHLFLIRVHVFYVEVFSKMSPNFWCILIRVFRLVISIHDIWVILSSLVGFVAFRLPEWTILLSLCITSIKSLALWGVIILRRLLISMLTCCSLKWVSTLSFRSRITKWHVLLTFWIFFVFCLFSWWGKIKVRFNRF